MPRSRDARRFYRAAKQRFEDAEFLLRGGRATGAVYLAGYSVECMLKALILDSVPEALHEEVQTSFRGARAHDYESMKAQFKERTGRSIPADLGKSLARVNSWAPGLRYEPGATKHKEAQAFLDASEDIIQWAEGMF